MLGCKVCASQLRGEIESALLKLDSISSDKGRAIRYLSEQYMIQENDLKVHALMHMPVSLDSFAGRNSSPATYAEGASGDEAGAGAGADKFTGLEAYKLPVDAVDVIVVNGYGTPSITKQLKLREADMLMAVAQEYMMTLQSIGVRIKRMARETSDESRDDDYIFARTITKPVVDLYVGAGRELRETIRAIAEINQNINGPKDNDVSGLKALAEAIKTSTETMSTHESIPPLADVVIEDVSQSD